MAHVAAPAAAADAPLKLDPPQSVNAQPPAPPTPPHPPPITYDLPPAPTALSRLHDQLTITSDKFAARAARFGVPQLKTSATELDVLGARRAHTRPGFASGFDPAAPDQHQRRQARAKRFADQFLPDAQTAARSARAERFGGHARHLVADAAKLCNDPLERRRDVAVGELPRPNVLHVFGVDLLTTSQLLTHFHEYGPSWCEWLNDSSCNVAFEDEHTMKRALRGLSDHAKQVGMHHIVEHAPQDRMDDGHGAGLALSVAAQGTLAEELTWRSAKPFEKGTLLLPIWIRQATEKDRRPEMPNPNSKWSRSVNSKKRPTQTRTSDSTRTDPAHGRRRSTDSNPSSDAQRHTRRGSAPGVHRDRKMAILKAQTKKVSRMDLDRALDS